jgi:hypothetical protein
MDQSPDITTISLTAVLAATAFFASGISSNQVAPVCVIPAAGL